MAQYNTLKDAVMAVIKTNGNKEITGELLQQTLLAIITSLGAGFQYMGVAAPSTNPGTPDQNVLYIAGPGTYPNFNGAVIPDQYVGFMSYNGAWTLATIKCSAVSIRDISDGIIQMMDGNNPVFPLTKAEAVFFNGDTSKTLDKEFSQLVQEVDTISNGIELELRGKKNVDVTKAGSTRLSQGLALPFTGTCHIMMSVKSGTDTSRWRLYRYVNGAIGSVLTEYTDFGVGVDVTIPSTDDGVWLFTEANSELSTRTYSVSITKIANTIVGRIESLEDESVKLQQVYEQRVVVVDAATKRSHSFQVQAGMKLKFSARMVSGDGTTFSVYHTSLDASNRIFYAISVDTVTDEYTVPDGITTIIIYVTKYDTGLSYELSLYNADNNRWLTDQMEQFGVLPFVKNTTPTTIEADLAVSSSVQYILPAGSGRITDKEGDVYLFINQCSALFSEYGTIRCSATDGTVIDIYAKEFGTLKPFKVFTGKTLNSIYVPADIISTAGHISLSVYSVLQSLEDVSYPLKGFKIFCFGDSITEFRNATMRRKYSDYLGMLSKAETINAGIGGTRLAQRLTPSLTPTTNQECVAAFDMVNLVSAWASGSFDYQDAAINSGLLTREQQTLYESKVATLKENPIAQADIVTIFGGTNDYTGGTSIGSETAGNTDKATLYGAVNVMVSALLTAKPTLKIYFFSPIIRMFEQTISIATSSDVYVHSSAPDGKTLPEFCEVIAKAVKLNHCPFCDWYWSLGWNVYNFSTYFGTDYTHPYDGFYWLGEKMYKFLLGN